MAIQYNKSKSVSILSKLSIIYYALMFPAGINNPIGLLLIIGVLFFERCAKIIYRKSIFIIILFVVTYFLFESVINYSFIKSISYASTLVIIYIFGLNLANINDKNNEILQKTNKALIIIYYCISIYIILSGLYTLVIYKEINATQRNMYSIWNGEILNPTHIGSLSTVPLSISIFLSLRRRNFDKLIHIIIATTLLVFNMMMSNRVILIFFVIFVIAALLCNNYGKKINVKFKFLIIFLIIILLLYGFYFYDLFNVRHFVSSIPVFQRISDLRKIEYKDPRLERQIYIILNMHKNLTGEGWFTNQIGESHNVWLDIYDYAGIIPFILFFRFTIMCISQVIQCYKYSNVNETYAILALTMFSYFLSFMVEPVFRSCESFFCLFIFCAGLLNRIEGGSYENNMVM